MAQLQTNKHNSFTNFISIPMINHSTPFSYPLLLVFLPLFCFLWFRARLTLTGTLFSIYNNNHSLSLIFAFGWLKTFSDQTTFDGEIIEKHNNIVLLHMGCPSPLGLLAFSLSKSHSTKRKQRAHLCLSYMELVAKA